MNTREIFFKKQTLGKWRRDDGESVKLVNEESMHREVQKLVNDGWSLQTHGVTFLRAITLTKPRSITEDDLTVLLQELGWKERR